MLEHLINMISSKSSTLTLFLNCKKFKIIKIIKIFDIANKFQNEEKRRYFINIEILPWNLILQSSHLIIFSWNITRRGEFYKLHDPREILFVIHSVWAFETIFKKQRRNNKFLNTRSPTINIDNFENFLLLYEKIPDASHNHTNYQPYVSIDHITMTRLSGPIFQKSAEYFL